MIRVALAIAALLLPLKASGLTWPWQDDPVVRVELPRPITSITLSDSMLESRSLPGTIVAKTEVTLAFQTLGRIASRPVDLGTQVVAGEVLAQLSPEDLRANVRAAQAGFDTAQVAFDTAKEAASRTDELARRNVASMAQKEQAQRGLKTAEAGLNRASSELAKAQDAQSYADLTAPFDGIVSAVFESPGAVVNAGSPVLTLSDTTDREAIIDLPDRLVAGLNMDQRFRIWLEADPDLVATARLGRIDPIADTATRTRRLHLAVEDGVDFRLGSLIRVQRVDLDGMLLSLPPQAVMERNGQSMIWVVTRKDDVARVDLREVRVEPNRDEVLILDGVYVGEEVVVRGVNSLTPGQQVGRSVAP